MYQMTIRRSLGVSNMRSKGYASHEGGGHQWRGSLVGMVSFFFWRFYSRFCCP